MNVRESYSPALEQGSLLRPPRCRVVHMGRIDLTQLIGEKGKGGDRCSQTTGHFSLCSIVSVAFSVVLELQSGAARHSLGFEDEDLESSPGWWAATVATYCPSRPGELPKFLSSKPCE